MLAITPQKMHPAIFLDRDGVITVPEFRDGRSYAPRTLQQLAYFPGTLEVLARLKQQGFLLIVVTNQPDVGNGIVAQSVVESMHAKMRAELPIDAIQVCYHAQKEQCLCRKPRLGMFYAAIAKFNIDVSKSFMVGDRSSDIEAGHALGCKTVFIDYGYDEVLTEPPSYFVASLMEFNPLARSVFK